MITNIPMNCWWSKSDAQKSYYFPLTSLRHKSTRVLQKMAHILSTISFQLLNGVKMVVKILEYVEAEGRRPWKKVFGQSVCP